MFELGTTIDLRNPETGDSSQFTINELEILPESGENVHRARGLRANESSTKSLILKQPKLLSADDLICLPNGTHDCAATLHRTWSRLRDTGISTVPEMWTVDTKTVAMTDMTERGGRFYGKSESKMIYSRGYKLGAEDGAFLQLDLQLIEAEAYRVALQALKAKVTFNQDDPLSLLMQSDGRFSILPLDIGWTFFGREQATAINHYNVQRFLGWIVSLRSKLLQVGG